MLSHGAIEIALNRYASQNPEAPGILDGLEGRSLRIEIRGTGLALNLMALNGHICCLENLSGEPDATLSGTPGELSRLMGEDAGTRLLEGVAEIRGNQQIATGFSRVLALSGFDWEEMLARSLGDIPAHQIGRFLREGQQWIRRTSREAGLDIGEYLQEEVALLPSRYEVEEFMADVDTLRADVDRLQARIDQLVTRKAT
jgi:ubiquinone biosynthesis accessory factor UbiJ